MHIFFYFFIFFGTKIFISIKIWNITIYTVFFYFFNPCNWNKKLSIIYNFKCHSFQIFLKFNFPSKCLFLINNCPKRDDLCWKNWFIYQKVHISCLHLFVTFHAHLFYTSIYFPVLYLFVEVCTYLQLGTYPHIQNISSYSTNSSGPLSNILYISCFFFAPFFLLFTF